MKKIVVLCAAMLCATLLTAGASAVEYENAYDAVENMTVGWNLGNTLDAHGEWIEKWTDNTPADYETSWGNPVATKELIDEVRAAGFNTIRVPVTWAQHIDDKGNIDKVWLDRVQTVVDYVMAHEDMYCILNVHHDGGAEGWLVASDECYDADADKFAGLWKNIAERFRDYDERLIFESFNEVLDEQDRWNSSDAEGHGRINDLNQLFVDTVRATGGGNADRNLMVQTYAASCQADALAAFVLPEDSTEDHLILHVHSYAPWGFTSDDATWTTMTDVWGADHQIAEIERLYKSLYDFSQKQGAPLVMGEFGSQDKGNEPHRAAHAKLSVAEAKKYGIRCIWWDNGSSYQLFDRSEYRNLHPMITDAMTQQFAADVKGDANGDGILNAMDAAYILTSLTNGTQLPAAADINCDGNANALDAAAILTLLVS